MDSFSLRAGNKIVADFVAVIQANKQYLSDLDGQIGDGDHGINMNKGFTLFQAAMEQDPGDLCQNLNRLSKILMGTIGGSMGPLYGMMFRGMARACADKQFIDRHVMQDMLQAALDEIRKISEAQVGDKTLMDVLIPAVEAYSIAASNGGFVVSMQAMQQAAIAGRDSTLDMVAKIGRSSRLGERSRGSLDAGAVSCCLLLESLANSVTVLLA